MLLFCGFIDLTAQYLKLEDACRRFRNPSIMDIKIGRVSYDPEADAEKIAIESKKYLPLQKLGFQLLGMRVRLIPNILNHLILS